METKRAIQIRETVRLVFSVMFSSDEILTFQVALREVGDPRKAAMITSMVNQNTLEGD